MPDWSYQTLFRPLLFKLPPRLSRAITLNAIGTLSRLPSGPFVIRTLGHMEPSPLLVRDLAGLSLSTPVGLSGSLDPQGKAHKALAQFGFGFIEHGPITVRPVHIQAQIENDPVNETISYPSYYENEGVERIAVRMRKPGHRLPQMARITPLPSSSAEEAIHELCNMMARISSSNAGAFYVDIVNGTRDWEETLVIVKGFTAAAASHNPNQVPLFLYVPPDFSNDRLCRLLDMAEASFWNGVVIGEAVHESKDIPGEHNDAAENSNNMELYPIKVGREAKAVTLQKINRLRSHYSSSFVIIAGGGIHEPQDALDLMDAGANAVMLHSGLVYAGPGLPKRINEAVIYEQVRSMGKPKTPSFWKHWGWMCLLGIGMIIGGILSWIIAATTVLLPYDLDFIELPVEELHGINHHLLHFMSHDRITLAGTMISIGILYYQMARYGLKDGLHWAKTALITSGLVGFSSFFLYLGYGYFDPLHALAAAMLFPMFLLALRSNPDQPYRKPVNLHNNRLWRMAMWGQLCFVVLGFALAIGGLTIATVGVTEVFVPEDLNYLNVTPAELNAANPRLIPLIAHDRAGFGGALFCDALAILIIALWGIQQGARWLWWTLLLGGAPGFYAGFSVHFSIGYTDFWHLLPAVFALLLYVIGIIFLYPYLMRSEPAK